MEFRKRLKQFYEARKKEGIRPGDIANALHISLSNLKRYTDGCKPPEELRKKILVRMAEAEEKSKGSSNTAADAANV